MKYTLSFQFFFSGYPCDTKKYSRQLFRLFPILFLLSSTFAFSQTRSTFIQISPGEKWWCGVVGLGSSMPFGNDLTSIDLSKDNFSNQTVPLLISSDGRYVWSDKPFEFSVRQHEIMIHSDDSLTILQSGNSLRSAFLEASKLHFPPSGLLPDALFFTRPVYNTWIELTYNQNQKDILNYAHQIIKNKFPTGILIIDDNWQKYYGNFDFKPDKFPHPNAMVNQLHRMGFKVMLWICPFVSPDSPEFRQLDAKGYLIKQKNTDRPALFSWWNGVSAGIDLTNPDAFNYLKEKLVAIQKQYGVDGFKFDGGDVSFYNGELDFFNKKATATDYSEDWAKLGLNFKLNEFRACWKMGGEALVQRLSDKSYSWKSLQLVIAEMLTSGLSGYAFTCPDMIGGGEFHSFQNVKDSGFDQSLILRSAALQALMPIMQFSVAPWRILSPENLALCRNLAMLHQKFGKYILQTAQNSAQTGEPMVRYLEYAFPHQGFSTCTDEFMLGNKFLVAPILDKSTHRLVKLPQGIWRDEMQTEIKGDTTIQIEAALNRLPYFERIK
jgi:alpha-glucosidase